MEKLIKDILSKKELNSLNDDLVKEFIQKYFLKKPKLKKKLEQKSFNRRSEEYKTVVKEVRKRLREIYGVFIQKGYSKKELVLSEIKEQNREKVTKELLKLHQSTKERLPFYKEIYRKIFEITGRQKTILDLACGLNPLSYFWLGYKPTYIASDIAKTDLEFIQEFFSKNKIKGTIIRADLVTEIEKIAKIKTNICFLLKTVDSLETRLKNVSKKLIEELNSDWIIVSFPKISLGGKKMIKKSRRDWFIKFLNQKDFYHTEFEVNNEYFIVIKKDLSAKKE